MTFVTAEDIKGLEKSLINDNDKIFIDLTPEGYNNTMHKISNTFYIEMMYFLFVKVTIYPYNSE